MSDKQKKQILLGIFLSIFLILPLIIYNEYRIGKKYMDDFEKVFQSQEPKILLLAHPNCIWCSYYEPILKEFSEEFHFQYTYFDIGAVTKKQLNKVLDMLNTNSGTPQTFLVQDSKVLSQLTGYQTEKELITWLKEHQFVKETHMLKYIDYKEYYAQIEDPEKKVIVIGRAGCPNSDEIKKMANEIIKEYNIDMYYLNIYDYSFGFLKEEERKKFEQTLPDIKEEQNTPFLFVFEDQKVIERKTGLLKKEELLAFLKSHDFIK